MAKPAVSGLLKNTYLSSAIMKFDGVDFGLVSGVKISNKEMTTDAHTDQIGKSLANTFYVGQEVQVELEMDEYTVAKMKQVYPNSKLITTGPIAKLTFGDSIGQNYLALAKVLEVIATADDTTNFGHYWKFFLAAPVPEATIEMGPGKQVKIKFKFKVYPDLTQVPGQWFGFMGDPAAGTLVPSSAAAAVPGGGNVGNGTVTGLSTVDLYTKTETWTMTCIATAVNGGVFSVVGSVTGARGNATVGSIYHSNSIFIANSELSFTINDGATDFALADTFTIATTAANYV
ncbi:MAG: hypothetical protein IPQ08_06205 [Chitinophagaceae bacterium]|nr:hypothetical protein [Chitinophagaceae bacterium]